jgi:hypothetical protein
MTAILTQKFLLMAVNAVLVSHSYREKLVHLHKEPDLATI